MRQLQDRVDQTPSTEYRAGTEVYPASATQPAGYNSTGSISVLKIQAALIDTTTFADLTNLTTTVLNAKVLSFSDEYFAAAENLLTPTPPIRKAGFYVHTGAWFDGWETRRHNREEFDWVVIKLGCVGIIGGVEVDTAYFNGNEAPEAGVDGCFMPTGDDVEIGKKEFSGWEQVLPKQPCGPSRRQAWKLAGDGLMNRQWTHLRLKMYPDGGIARLRVYGWVVPPPLNAVIQAGANTAEKPLEDLASALNGGRAMTCSDQHFGIKSNLLLPGRGKDMGDGWETARSRAKDHVDWVVIKLGLLGRTIEKIVVDTKDFRGNFPRAVKVEGWKIDENEAASMPEPRATDEGWIEVVKGARECAADKEHIFEASDLVENLAMEGQVWTHVKMTIIPDGGVKRLRVFGRRV